MHFRFRGFIRNLARWWHGYVVGNFSSLVGDGCHLLGFDFLAAFRLEAEISQGEFVLVVFGDVAGGVCDCPSRCSGRQCWHGLPGGMEHIDLLQQGTAKSAGDAGIGSRPDQLIDNVGISLVGTLVLLVVHP